jgi:hypothetical protein
MKTLIAELTTLGALCLTGLLQAGTPLGSAPTSGVIVRGDQKVWFDGNNTRTEHHGWLSTIAVTGERGSWHAFPHLNRVMTNTVQSQPLKSFQEQCRTAFYLQTTNRVRVGEEEFLGLPCWRYEWIETNLPPAFAAALDGRREVQFLFLANPAFPLTMRSGTGGSWNTNADVREVSFNISIPAGLFDLPEGFKVTRQFQVPRKPFQLLFTQTRSSREWGWATFTTNEFTSDGDTIKETRTYVHRDENGETITGPTETVVGFEEAIPILDYPMRAAMWEWGKRIGTDEILGFSAEVYEASNPPRRSWIIDHPQFGAFSARLVMGGEEPETNEVVRIWVDASSTAAFRNGLDVYVPGVYSASFEARDADGQLQRMEGRATVSRILGGQFVQIDIEAGSPPTPTLAKTLVQYDAEKGLYRTWFFTDSGYVTQGESRRSQNNPRTSVSEGMLNNMRYKGTTEHSEDYTSVVDTYHWYDESGKLLRTDISKFRLLAPRQDAPADKGAEVQ